MIRRQAVKSLSELMCEFDTMSQTEEVISAVYEQIEGAIAGTAEGQVVMDQAMLAHLQNLRGIYEGTYRQR